jgi:hypothetical protein
VEIAEAFDGETLNLSLNDLHGDRVLIEKSVGWGQEWLMLSSSLLSSSYATFMGAGNMRAAKWARAYTGSIGESES